jgi:translation elongation factor EF-Ts
MDISLEKVDIIRDRTGVTYKDAKDALEAANGNVVDALINIEEAGDRRWTETISVKGSEAVDKLRGIVKSGNVNRIRVKNDDYVILDIPVTAGAISAVAFPQFMAIGTAVALLSKCTIEVERPNKQTINVSEAITNTTEDIANKIKNAAEEFKNMKSNITSRDTAMSDAIDAFGTDAANVKVEDTFKQ